MNTHKRTRYYIDRSFQFKFMMKYAMIVFAGGVVSALLALYSTQSTLTTSFHDARLVVERTSLAIMPSIIFTNLVTTTILIIFTSCVTLFVSHKIAGPMFRISQDIKTISSGDLQKRIGIRSGDQFREVVDNLNDMLDSLNEKVTDIQEELDRLHDYAEENDLPEEARQIIDRCHEKIHEHFEL